MTAKKILLYAAKAAGSLAACALAFAALWPEQRVLLMFIIPIKTFNGYIH